MGKKQNVRRRPPNTLTKERQKQLADSAEARAQSLKKDVVSGNASRTAENPGVGRSAKSEVSAKPEVSEEPEVPATEEKGVDDVS
jgi:hypothetical protein